MAVRDRNDTDRVNDAREELQKQILEIQDQLKASLTDEQIFHLLGILDRLNRVRRALAPDEDPIAPEVYREKYIEAMALVSQLFNRLKELQR
jgi:hypothetical protein